MRVTLLIASLITLASCQNQLPPIDGIWKVHSQFYAAKCKIYEDDNSLKGRALYYNDGTTIYHDNEKQPMFFFRDLQAQGNMYVDGISGATHTDKQQNNLSIEVKAADTLLVTSYVLGKPIKEIWTRNH